MHDDLPASELATLLRGASLEELFVHFDGGGLRLHLDGLTPVPRGSE